MPRMTETQWTATHESVALAAWEKWTQNGLDLDEDTRMQTEKHAADMANNAWQDGMDEAAWLAATLAALGVPKPV